MRNGFIDSEIVRVTPLQTVHIELKANNGDLYLDARKWFKFENSDIYIPSKKGLQMRREDWKRAIPLIQELLESAEGKTSNKEAPIKVT